MLFKLSSFTRILASLVLGLTIPQLVTAAELPVNLRGAARFAVLAGTTVTSTGATVVNGDLGLWPGTAISGFPPGQVVGTIYINDPQLIAKNAQGDLTTAFNDAAGRSTAPVTIAGDIGGQTLAPGLYKSTSTLQITGNLTLDAQGNPNAVWIFQIASSFNTAGASQVILIGGAQAANVFWQVGSSATIGTTSSMKGTILALTSITLNTGASLQGRLLARNGQVALQGNGITVSTPPDTGGAGGGGGNGNALAPSTNLFVTAISPIVLNPQTGLFEQTVHLANNSANAVAASRLLVEALPPDVQVYNASGSVSGIPFVQFNFPIAANSGVDLLLEYYRASRLAIPQPSFVAQDSVASQPNVTGSTLAIDRNVQFENGRFLIEFFATQGRQYAIQYSSDMATWKTATPAITAPSNRVQWYDDGPPKTESKPTTGSRFYRVIQLP
jgi:hypothetical protein